MGKFVKVILATLKNSWKLFSGFFWHAFYVGLCATCVILGFKSLTESINRTNRTRTFKQLVKSFGSVLLWSAYFGCSICYTMLGVGSVASRFKKRYVFA